MSWPKKLYINKFMIRPGMLYPAEFPPDNPEQEYIRTEALLEWAREQYNQEEQGSWYSKGRADAFNKLIAKLNELI